MCIKKNNACISHGTIYIFFNTVKLHPLVYLCLKLVRLGQEKDLNFMKLKVKIKGNESLQK